MSLIISVRVVSQPARVLYGGQKSLNVFFTGPLFLLSCSILGAACSSPPVTMDPILFLMNYWGKYCISHPRSMAPMGTTYISCPFRTSVRIRSYTLRITDTPETNGNRLLLATVQAWRRQGRKYSRNHQQWSIRQISDNDERLHRFFAWVSADARSVAWVETRPPNWQHWIFRNLHHDGGL